ncbi:type II toxin-antitoxin system HigB family toxin [Flavitalea sp. BT771]|uniref:type II toxin-antitoxin system HigB family toxin n=1 Tax=Flavitalea sp. BT771 TaxID=3063329 RepID=UPI0026E44D4F|nr:type II toxin-antitoxin system HigB family toxin [Flavitalea sp. BT771]MDO6432184.1 type II toxin-antitoxin system HigB family toxin [Flavitalea sp. BT771]MDV6221094.1 type II toxin-antitoxin system HigB family toxin [Flavitalea sp. BT771]
MVIISRPVIRDFISRYPLSANALNEWYSKTMGSDWAQFSDVKKNWNSCDAIGNDRSVFDIAGNNYRLIAMIHFKKRTLYIRRVLTHKEYDVLNKRGELNTL